MKLGGLGGDLFGSFSGISTLLPTVFGPLAPLVGLYDAQQAAKDAERAADAQRQELAALMSKPPATIPRPDDATVKRARVRSIAEQMRRRGRKSTILTNQELSTDPLGA